MKRWFLLILLLIPSHLYSQAACTITINSDYTTVHNFFANNNPRAPVDGDVVCLNAGDNTGVNKWAGQIDPTVGGTIAVEIRGAGGFSTMGSAKQTKIESATGYVFAWFSTNTAHNTTIDNLDITFTTSDGDPKFGVLSLNGGRIGSDKPFIIHHNDFHSPNACNGGWIETSISIGVVYRNTFTMPGDATCPGGNTDVFAVHAAGNGSGSSAQAAWASASTFGSADTNGDQNIYVENNVFTNFNVAADWTSGSRAVWRFNTMNNAATSGHGFDTEAVGGRGLEEYYNTFVCDATDPLQLSAGWIFHRSGTGFLHNNTFPAMNSNCASSLPQSPIFLNQYNLIQCGHIAGWPGTGTSTGSDSTYPISHQVGWGWINGSNIIVGTSANQDLPGLNGYINGAPGDGYQQALEPWYAFNNTNNTGTTPTTYIGTGYTSECRAMAYSNHSKVSGTTLVIPGTIESGYPKPYANVGQQLVVAFADLVGGTTPTIASSPTCTWSALTTASNAGTRLSAWTCTAVTSGGYTVTITHDSSSAARAGTLIILRGLTASPVDQNPAVGTIASTTTFNAPSTTNPLASDNEIILGYYALNTATVFDPNSGNTGTNGTTSDYISPGSSDLLPISCFPGCDNHPDGLAWGGINGTSGGSDVTVGTTYRVITSKAAVYTPQLVDNTAARTGLAGTITLKVNGSTSSLPTPLEYEPRDFVQYDREVYDDVPANGGTFNATTGTGSGTAASIPNGAGGACTNGTAYWATDVGSWNTSGSGGQGVLFVCGKNATSGHWPATLTTGNAFYIPKNMPHPLDTVGAGNSMSFTQQPTPLQSGTTFSVVVKVTVNPPAADSITITKNCAGGTLTGTTTVTSNGTTGDASFTGLGMTGVDPSCTLTATNNTDATISPITSNAFALTCAPTKVVFTSQPTGASLGASLGTVKVTEEDNSGNICSLASDTITLSKDSGATWGTLVSASNLAKAASAGVATWTDLSVTTTAGAGSIDATSPGLTSAVSNSITISGGGCTPDHLTFISQPQSALLGQSVGTIQVAVKDSGGNTCNDTSTVTLAAHTGTCIGMTLNGTLSGSAVAGVFQTSNVNATVATGSCSFDATDGVLTLATSNPFTIRAPAAGAGGRAGMVIRRGRH